MKFSIITVCYNSEKTIRRTFESVLNQSVTDYEYIVVDGASKDGTLDIIREYEEKFNGRMRWISEPDNGIYDAVAKGFKMSSGEILTWLGSDDLLFPTAFETANEIFEKYQQVEWLAAQSCFATERGTCACDKLSMTWSYRHFITGHAIHLQQEGSFFKRCLWDEAGACFAPLRWAADYELWLRFSKITDCYVVPALTAAFRLRSSGQASFENKNSYCKEIAQAAEMHLKEETLMRQFGFKILKVLYSIPRLKQVLFFVEKFFRKQKVYFVFDRAAQSWTLLKDCIRK